MKVVSVPLASPMHSQVTEKVPQKLKMKRTSRRTWMSQSSKSCAAIPVPQKGLDHEEDSVREALRYLYFLGYQSVMVKTDHERALNAVVKRVRPYRGDGR